MADLTGTLGKGDALAAIVNEDPQRQSHVEVPWLCSQIRSWMTAAAAHLNPQPPLGLAPGMKLYRFVKSCPGFSAMNDRRSISCFAVGERVAFGPLEAAFLMERGYMVEVKADVPCEASESGNAEVL